MGLYRTNTKQSRAIEIGPGLSYIPSNPLPSLFFLLSFSRPFVSLPFIISFPATFPTSVSSSLFCHFLTFFILCHCLTLSVLPFSTIRIRNSLSFSLSLSLPQTRPEFEVGELKQVETVGQLHDHLVTTWRPWTRMIDPRSSDIADQIPYSRGQTVQSPSVQTDAPVRCCSGSSRFDTAKDIVPETSIRFIKLKSKD